MYQVKEYVNAAIEKITAGGGTATVLDTSDYWSSSQDDDYNAYRIYFSNGYDIAYDKDYNYSVRAVRAF